MKKNLLALTLILTVLLVSVSIIILPSFFSKGISRIDMKEKISLDLILNTKEDIEILFFGYAGCLDVCTPRLQDLGQWYNTLDKEIRQHVKVSFLDLSAPEDKNLPDLFAKYFNPQFHGIFLEKSLLKTYTKALRVYFSKSLFYEGEIDHSTHLYMLKRDFQGKFLRFIYTAYPYNFDQIQSDIKRLINE